MLAAPAGCRVSMCPCCMSQSVHALQQCADQGSGLFARAHSKRTSSFSASMSGAPFPIHLGSPIGDVFRGSRTHLELFLFLCSFFPPRNSLATPNDFTCSSCCVCFPRWLLVQVQAEGRRNKVPLEKGFSQVSWLKLTKSNTDLTGARVGEACMPAMRIRCCGVGVPFKESFPICRKFPSALTEWTWC